MSDGRHVRFDAAQGLSDSQQTQARTNLKLAGSTVATISALPTASTNPGVTLYCTESRCTFFSNGTTWIQTSTGEFTDTEMQALTAANFNNITIYNSTYGVAARGNGTGFVAKSGFLLKAATAVATVTNTTAETLCDVTQIPTWILGAGWRIDYSARSEAPTAGTNLLRLRFDESVSGVSGTVMTALSASSSRQILVRKLQGTPQPAIWSYEVAGNTSYGVIASRTSSSSPVYLKTTCQLNTNPASVDVADIYIYVNPGV